MNRRLLSNTRGIAHVGTILIVVFVFGVISFAAWRVATSSNNQNKNNSLSNCDSKDNNLCKFISVFNSVKSFKANVTTKSDGKSDRKSIYTTDGKNRSNIKYSGIKVDKKTVNYEYTVIDNIIYIKAANDVWWKQALNSDRRMEFLGIYDFEFKPPSNSDTAVSSAKYNFLLEDYCGDMLCYKYQVIEPESGVEKYIWFDTQVFLLRRMTVETDTNSSEYEFIYADVSVSEPKKSKVLGPNEFILPGKSKPKALKPSDTIL